MADTVFVPTPGTSTSIAATGTTASAALSATSPQVRVYNSGTVAAFIRFGKGAQTAVATDMALAPGAVENFGKLDADTIAAITGGTAATIYIISGTGV